jgi:hypothetical protein
MDSVDPLMDLLSGSSSLQFTRLQHTIINYVLTVIASLVIKVNHGRMMVAEPRRYLQIIINDVDHCHSRGVPP